MKKPGVLISFFVLSTTAALIFSGCDFSDLKAKSGLLVKTNDIPASVYLDKKLMGKTPFLNNSISPDEYSLEIRPDDPQYIPYQTDISLKKRVLTTVVWKPGTRSDTNSGVIYESEPLKNSNQSQLSITTIPDGGIVQIDDQAKTFAPVLLDNIQSGAHEYQVQLPSYETQKNSINVLAGYKMNVIVKLGRLL